MDAAQDRQGEQHPPPAPDRPDWADQAEEEYRQMQDTEWADERLPNTAPSGDTVEADRADARRGHDADQVDEEAAAHAPPGPADPDVAATYQEAIERGAAVEGEGQIVPDDPAPPES